MNFAVTASQEIITKCNDILAKVQLPGEKKGEALSRAFDIVGAEIDGKTIREGGVDVEALDAALKHIRGLFLAAVSGKEEIVAEKDAQIRDLKNARTQIEDELNRKLSEADAARQHAETDASSARKELEQASQMVKCIDTFHTRLAKAEEMEKEYDRLKREKVQAEDLATALNQKLEEQEAGFNRQIQTLKKDHAAEMEKLKDQMERSVSDAKKDAALEKEKALAVKEREMNAQAAEKLREVERENIRLQMENEALGGSGGPGKVPFSERTVGGATAQMGRQLHAGMNRD